MPFDLLDGALAIVRIPLPRKRSCGVVDPAWERSGGAARQRAKQYLSRPIGVLSVIYDARREPGVRHANVEHYYLQPVRRLFMGETSSAFASWLTKGWQTPSMEMKFSDYKKFALPAPKRRMAL